MRSVREIAIEIRGSWKNVHFSAVPYLSAMLSLQTVNDTYGIDSGRDIVLRFLCNAATWRGDVAKRVKKELRDLLDSTINPADADADAQHFFKQQSDEQNKQ